MDTRPTTDRNIAGEYELTSNKAEIARELSGYLADLYLVYLKTQAFHWNVVGSHFIGLHKLFEEQYEALQKAVDECAERIRALGFKAPGSFAEFSELASVEEETNSASMSDREMLHRLVNDHKALGQEAAKVITLAEERGDHVTADFLIRRQEFHEKSRWMLDSHLEKPDDLGLPPRGIN
jgi:starvation-inducible DNA-binding protein